MVDITNEAHALHRLIRLEYKCDSGVADNCTEAERDRFDGVLDFMYDKPEIAYQWLLDGIKASQDD